MGDLNIYEFTQLSIKDELEYINNLKLNKLLDQEVLIIGNILRVELDD